MEPKQKVSPKDENGPKADPFKGLKYIAYCRSQLPPKELDVKIEDMDFVNYAKWQVCKARNILWKDPVWDDYGVEEIMVEYFAIRFDESPEEVEAFLTQLKGVEAVDYDWLYEMETKYTKTKEAEIKEKTGGKDEFEESFT